MDQASTGNSDESVNVLSAWFAPITRNAIDLPRFPKIASSREKPVLHGEPTSAGEGAAPRPGASTTASTGRAQALTNDLSRLSDSLHYDRVGFTGRVLRYIVRT